MKMDIRIEKIATPKQKPDESALGFGQYFTDHMFIMDYTRAKGWHDARIVPFGNLSLHPACTVFHYGAEIFEGMKAYRTADGSIQLFRILFFQLFGDILDCSFIFLDVLFKTWILYRPFPLLSRVSSQ